MAEVFRGTPVLISVRIDGPDGRMKEYHVAGQEIGGVAEAVKKALEDMPSLEGAPAPKAARKTRGPNKTKASIAAAPVTVIDRKETAGAGDGKAWP